MPVTATTYQALALEDPKSFWELHYGRVRKKPSDMSYPHNEVMTEITRQLHIQLDPKRYRARMNAGRLRGEGHSYIPDVVVIPVSLARLAAASPRALEEYGDPLPFVAEVWSPSTGDYDDDEKFPAYRRRGDDEVWRIHPCESTATIWRRQPGGDYEERTLTGGLVTLAALPTVSIDLDLVFRAAAGDP